jgi:hypothetical protein
MMAGTLAFCSVLELIGYEMDLNSGTMVEHPKRDSHSETLMEVLDLVGRNVTGIE